MSRRHAQNSPASEKVDAEGYLRSMRASSVYNVAIKSELQFAPKLSRSLEANVWLKREDRQQVGSFKLRGAYNMMARLSPGEMRHGVVTASAGNHAQGVALAARMLRLRALVVVPKTAPTVKKNAVRDLGAELVEVGDTVEDAIAYAHKLARERGLAYVHPFDHSDVIAGQGTIGIEIAESFEGSLDAVFVPVGGGGLIAGIALAIKQLRPGALVVGVEPDDCSAMYDSLKAGRRITLDKVGLLADGVAVKTVGEETFRIAREYVDKMILVSNDEICGAAMDIYDECRAIVEPSGALAVAGMKRWVQTAPPGKRSVACVLSGANMNFERLMYVAERALVGARRERLFAIKLPERPGSFRKLCAAFGERALSEFNYRMEGADEATVFAGLYVDSDREGEKVKALLEAAGFPAIDLTDDELAKTHIRHMVGGRSEIAAHERVFHIEFPQRPGALAGLLAELGGRWNISLFHYRNHGADRGRALAGLQVPPGTEKELETFLKEKADDWTEVTNDPAVKLFLT